MYDEQTLTDNTQQRGEKDGGQRPLVVKRNGREHTTHRVSLFSSRTGLTFVPKITVSLVVLATANGCFNMGSAYSPGSLQLQTRT